MTNGIVPPVGSPGLSDWLSHADAARYRKALRVAREEALSRLVSAASTSSDPDVRGAVAVLRQIDAIVESLTKKGEVKDDGFGD